MGTEWYKQLLKETVRYIQVPTDRPPSRSAHSASSSPVCHSLDSDLTLIPRGDPHLAASQAGSGWWPWPVPRRSPRPRGSCRGGTPRREGRTAGRWSRSKAWCTSRCQQGDPSRPQLAWFLPWKPMHPAQQGQPLPSRGSAWAEWRQATPSASTAPTPRHPGTRSARCVGHGEPLLCGSEKKHKHLARKNPEPALTNQMRNSHYEAWGGHPHSIQLPDIGTGPYLHK